MSTFLKSTGLRISLALMLVAVLFAGIAAPVQAADIDNDGYVGPNEVIDDDLIISGEKVVIEGTVNGLLIASGATVTIKGQINGDAILLGSTVEVTEEAVITGNVFSGATQVKIGGQVGGSVAMGGQVIYMEGAQVGSNVYFGSYSFQDDARTSVARGVYGGAYQIILNGTVDRDVNLSAAALELGGKVNGDAVLDVEAPGSGEEMPFSPFMFMPQQYGVEIPPTLEPGLRISDSAEIGGRLVYTSPVEQTEAIETAPQGGVIYQTPVPAETSADGETALKPAEPERGTFGFFASRVLKWFWKLLRDLITLLLLGGLCVWLIPALYQKTVEAVKAKPGPAAGAGALVYLGGHVGAFVAFFLILIAGLLFSVLTLGGISSTIFGLGFSALALAFAAFRLLVVYGSKLVIAYLAGEWVLGKVAPQARNKAVWSMVIGVVIYIILRSIPIVGWLFGLVVTIFGLGGMWLVFQNWRKPAASSAVESAPVVETPAE